MMQDAGCGMRVTRCGMRDGECGAFRDVHPTSAVRFRSVNAGYSCQPKNNCQGAPLGYYVAD
jgi:hypothetical protein